MPDALFASRAAADLAAELELDPAAIRGTGSAGRITIDDVRTAGPVAPPPSLGEPGQALWSAILGEFELRADELPVLFAACRTEDELERMGEALAKSEPVVSGSRGQTRPHPLIAEVRQHRLALQRLLGALGLHDEEEDAETDGAARSTAGRKLAAARWGNRRG